MQGSFHLVGIYLGWTTSRMQSPLPSSVSLWPIETHTSFHPKCRTCKWPSPDLLSYSPCHLPPIFFCLKRPELDELNLLCKQIFRQATPWWVILLLSPSTSNKIFSQDTMTFSLLLLFFHLFIR